MESVGEMIMSESDVDGYAGVCLCFGEIHTVKMRGDGAACLLLVLQWFRKTIY